ncbi:MAG: lysophospholipid acyltransferase family protein [Beijerinckiaceae bacterium]
MQAVRSLIFNTAFYLVLIVLMIAGSPALLFGRHTIFALARLWARITFWLLRVICGIRYEFRGMENVPEGGIIVAAKHQSFWETFALSVVFRDFTYILKRELTWIPLFGWYMKRSEMIAIDRGSGRSALKQVVERSKPVLASGRQIVIFPEGTRRPVGAPPVYKYGIAFIYAGNNAPCLPVAMNSGLFWPRRTFLRRPGTIVVEFLEPIPPGMDRDPFFATLQDRLESATNRLIEEAVAKDPALGKVVERNRTEPARTSRAEDQVPRDTPPSGA